MVSHGTKWIVSELITLDSSMDHLILFGDGRKNDKVVSSIVNKRRKHRKMPTSPSLFMVLLFFLLAFTVSQIDAASPTTQDTFQPSRSSCDLDAYDNRDDIVSADSKDCVACYNAGCSWFDCADIDVDTGELSSTHLFQQLSSHLLFDHYYECLTWIQRVIVTIPTTNIDSKHVANTLWNSANQIMPGTCVIQVTNEYFHLTFISFPLIYRN